jgi:hypothetical protein
MARGTREVWAKRVQRWVDSGLTAKEFAAEAGINARTLTFWKWRLGAGASRGAGETATSARFVEIVAPPATASADATSESRRVPAKGTPPGAPEPFEVILRGGYRLLVPVTFDALALRRVVDVLEGR